MNIAKLYTDELHDKFNYLAIWYPSIKLSLGDIGYFNNKKIFVPIGKIDGNAVDLTPVISDDPTDFSHHSKHGFEYDVKLKNKTSPLVSHILEADAGVGMKFKREGAMFFQLDEVTHERIGDQIALARELLRLANADEWDKEWVVVTEVLRAKKFVVLVSETGAGEAELTAKADLSALGLKALTAEGGLSVVHSDGLDTQITTPADSANMTPLFRAIRVKRKFFVGPKKVSPAYVSDIDDFIVAPQPDPMDVIEDVSSYPESAAEVG